MTFMPREIARERAAALGRIGGPLEGLIAELRRLREELPTAALERRLMLVRGYAAAREKALLYRWYLIVQREANGLYDSAAVDRRDPLPPPIDASDFETDRRTAWSGGASPTAGRSSPPP